MNKQELIASLLTKIAAARLTADEMKSVSVRAEYILRRRNNKKSEK
jgi:hypothetical protein